MSGLADSETTTPDLLKLSDPLGELVGSIAQRPGVAIKRELLDELGGFVREDLRREVEVLRILAGRNERVERIQDASLAIAEGAVAADDVQAGMSANRWRLVAIGRIFRLDEAGTAETINCNQNESVSTCERTRKVAERC